jgi:SAM-dependent methyltransferase
MSRSKGNLIRRPDPYTKLADIYDSETSDRSIQAFYREWRTFLGLAIRKYGVKVRVLVDLACGTGNTTIPWTRRRGWTVIGVDRSEAMLREARKKSRRVRWYRQDLRTLDLQERAEVVTCHFDALNHILVPRDLQKVFFNVARILNEGGLFQFDLNTEHWFRWLSVHEKLYRLPPYYLMSTNEYDSRRRVATFHQLWFVRRHLWYEKRDIRVRERAYTSGEIQLLLKKAGLRLLKLKTQRKLEGKAIRMLYLVQKPKRAAFETIHPDGR